MQLLSTSLFNQREGVTRVRGRDAAEGAAFAGKQPRWNVAEEAGSAKLGAVAAAFVLEQAAVHGAVASRSAGKHVVQGIDQWTADMAQLREIHGSAAYPVQMHYIGFFHLGRVKSHAQHIQGERQVFSSFRQQNVKSMGQMAAQGVRSPSGGCPVDFQAVNFFAPPEQQGGFQAGNMPVQSVAQPVRGGAGRDAMGDLKYCSALRRSHIGKYED